MDTEVLIGILENHLRQIEKEASELYKVRLKKTIDKLKSGGYIQRDEDLILDLQTLGFADKAQLIRRGMYT